MARRSSTNFGGMAIVSTALQVGLDAFAEHFRAQMDFAGPPVHEHSVHFCLAWSFQSVYQWPLGAIVFEHPAGKQQTDIWIAPLNLAIEIKYHRSIPSGHNRPHTQQFGSLLADFNKVASAPSQRRVVVMVSDTTGLAYLKNSGASLLPLHVGQSAMLAWASVAQLAQTAVASAQTHGPWVDHEAKLIWRWDWESWHALAWDVVPAST
ncbi:MAG: hypothetical protein IT305_22800 [Chloroflexi bacterium]|nr:hypothetical protein [Chloroflexota bacterium]